MSTEMKLTLLYENKPRKKLEFELRDASDWRIGKSLRGCFAEKVLDASQQPEDERIIGVIITFTCNPKWPEITRYLEKGNLKYDDRPDIVCRIFLIKLDALMKDLTEGEHFGLTFSATYTIEFGKERLPHAHIVLSMHPSNKLWPCSVGRRRKMFSCKEGNEEENDQGKPNNEIRDYLDCRYVSPYEAV